MNLRSRIDALEKATNSSAIFVDPETDPAAVPIIVLQNGDYELFGMRFAAGTPVQWAGRFYRLKGEPVPFAFFWDDDTRHDSRSIQARWKAAVERTAAAKGGAYEPCR